MDMTETKRVEETMKERRLEKEIEIAAPVDEVWKALTESKELVKWFSLEAQVTPGVGGKIFLSWGANCEGEAEIVAWEPGKTFAWKENIALVEWTLQARGGRTLLRLAQSGFLGNEDWENEWFESTDYGWGFMLLSLQWALEHHRGENRQVAWPRHKVNLSRAEAYARLLQAGGVFASDVNSRLQPERDYSLETATAEHYSGRVQFVRALRGFCVSVRELNDALFWLTIEGAPGKIEVQIWLSSFSLPQAKIETFEKDWSAQLKQIFS
jgi:uncharacterized protein YndB with AHSA1/START domain